MRSETLDVIHEMSELLNTGLDRETLKEVAELCDQGFNPYALAQVLKELRAEQLAQKDHLAAKPSR